MRVVGPAQLTFLCLQGTWFHPGLGHCGKRNNDNDAIVAIGIGRYGSGSNCDQVRVTRLTKVTLSSIHHPFLKWVQITNLANGRTAYGLTRDSCQSCSTEDLG